MCVPSRCRPFFPPTASLFAFFSKYYPPPPSKTKKMEDSQEAMLTSAARKVEQEEGGDGDASSSSSSAAAAGSADASSTSAAAGGKTGAAPLAGISLPSEEIELDELLNAAQEPVCSPSLCALAANPLRLLVLFLSQVLTAVHLLATTLLSLLLCGWGACGVCTARPICLPATEESQSFPAFAPFGNVAHYSTRRGSPPWRGDKLHYTGWHLYLPWASVASVVEDLGIRFGRVASFYVAPCNCPAWLGCLPYTLPYQYARELHKDDARLALAVVGAARIVVVHGFPEGSVDIGLFVSGKVEALAWTQPALRGCAGSAGAAPHWPPTQCTRALRRSANALSARPQGTYCPRQCSVGTHACCKGGAALPWHWSRLWRWRLQQKRAHARGPSLGTHSFRWVLIG